MWMETCHDRLMAITTIMAITLACLLAMAEGRQLCLTAHFERLAESVAKQDVTESDISGQGKSTVFSNRKLNHSETEDKTTNTRTHHLNPLNSRHSNSKHAVVSSGHMTTTPGTTTTWRTGHQPEYHREAHMITERPQDSQTSPVTVRPQDSQTSPVTERPQDSHIAPVTERPQDSQTSPVLARQDTADEVMSIKARQFEQTRLSYFQSHLRLRSSFSTETHSDNFSFLNSNKTSDEAAKPGTDISSSREEFVSPENTVTSQQISSKTVWNNNSFKTATINTTHRFAGSKTATMNTTHRFAGLDVLEYRLDIDSAVSVDSHVLAPADQLGKATFTNSYSCDVTRDRPSRDSVTRLLDSLMLGYDKRLRPGFGGLPLIVKADIEIRSMGPISEKDMIYSMDCYFRQVWTDRRLAFNASQEKVTNVSLNVMMLERIWRPDTIFINGGPSYVHTITTPNKFFRLSHDGTILYSQRLTIKASCPMNLEKFPMDTQQCPLHIASFGYPVSDVIYEWHYGNELAAVAANDMRLSQFDLQGMPACNVTKEFKGSPHSVLTVFFSFRRHAGYFLIQVYLPCCLLVVLSWVSFWINREATADRISLGSLTMLTMTFLVLDTRNDLPRVDYSTALDIYVLMCFCFIFASIIQFATVHFFTKYGTAEGEGLPVPDSDEEDDREEERFDPVDMSHTCHNHLATGSLAACLSKMWRCIMSTRSTRFKKTVRNALGLNSVSKIDKVARVLFPAAFSVLNIIYWMSYW